MILRALRSKRMVSSVASASPEGLVIDIGCGRGITVDFLRANGVNAIGVDMGTPQPIVPGVAPFLHLGQDAMALPLELRRQVRAMLLLDVLEHVPEPNPFLTALIDAFEQCVDVVITVPARQELWSNYDEYYGHFRRYDLRSVRSLFPNRLLKMTGARYAFRLLYPPVLGLNLLGRERAISIDPPTEKVRLLHRVIARYFDVESAIVPRWVPGTSLLVTLKRRRKRAGS
jgi:hypothetical protein